MNKKRLLLICLLLLSSCSQLPTSRDEAKELVLQKVRPGLEKILQQENPIDSSERSTYPLVQKLPGKSFDPRKTIRSVFNYDSKGQFLLSSGDYIFPVMTYCMKSSASSPAGHIYSLSQLIGKRAKIIRELNLLASAKYFVDEIQMVSWGIQNGLSYEELGKLGQAMIDSVIPHYKSELKESVLTQIERRWSQTSNLSVGILPSFRESAKNLEENLGEVGQRIREMREFRDRLREVGYDYVLLSELVDTTTRSEVKGYTPWSKVSNSVYARFTTEGSFGQIGYIQVRVTNSGREINSVNNKQEVLDLVSLIANPNSKGIQPLSFSPLYGFGGTITLTPALSRNPLAGALLLAAVLGAKYIDWNSFFDLQDIFQDSSDRDVQKEIERGMQALSKEQDKLEKPLKEVGIISGKTENTSKKKNGEVREYTKGGGDEALQKDFDKLPGKSIKSKTDGVEYKEYSDGTRIVKTPKKYSTEKGDRAATLEVQPNNHSEIDSKLRIKVRYP